MRITGKCYVEVVKGFAKGTVVLAQKVVEDGTVYYVCRPDHNFQVWYTEDYVKTNNREVNHGRPV